MASKNTKNGFFKVQLDEAQRRFQAFEQDAEAVLKGLISKGKAHRRELEGLMEKLNAGELLESPTVKQLGKKANQASNEVRKKLDGLTTRVVQAAGVASQSQVREINREITKLSKKIDSLLAKKGAPSA